MLALLAALLTAPAARAQDAVDVGVVKQSDAIVVQKLKYPKAHRSELASSIGVIPFNAYTFAPLVQVEFDHHLTEAWSFGALVGFGYGFNTPTYTKLVEEYGIAPYEFRYLGSVLGGVAWAPVYAKASIDGAHILHFDLFLTGRAGVTIEQATIPTGGRPVAPTLSPGLGARVYIGRTLTLRLELRDDVLFQWHKLTTELKVPQNVAITAGLSSILGKREQ